ncbi:hypothetical protein R6Q59_020195 [Mikania micrantha]
MYTHYKYLFVIWERIPEALTERLANLLAFSAPLPPLSLSGHLGALAGDLGCFPLDDEAYPPSSHWPTLTSIWYRSRGPHRNSTLPLDVQSTAVPQRISGRTN